MAEKTNTKETSKGKTSSAEASKGRSRISVSSGRGSTGNRKASPGGKLSIVFSVPREEYDDRVNRLLFMFLCFCFYFLVLCVCVLCLSVIFCRLGRMVVRVVGLNGGTCRWVEWWYVSFPVVCWLRCVANFTPRICL